MHSPDTLRRELAKRVAASGTQRKYAASIGVSQQYVHDVLHGKRAISAQLAAKLGYELVVSFRRATGGRG